MTELTGVLAQVEALCSRLEDGMDRLRWDPDISMPGVAAEGEDLIRVLLAVRANLDLAEQLIREARRERRRFAARARLRRRERELAYDQRLGKRGEGAVRREYEGAREREAGARLDVLDLTRRAVTAEEASAMVDDCFAGLKDAYFGLLNVRGELIERLRDRQFESNLER